MINVFTTITNDERHSIEQLNDYLTRCNLSDGCVINIIPKDDGYGQFLVVYYRDNVERVVPPEPVPEPVPPNAADSKVRQAIGKVLKVLKLAEAGKDVVEAELAQTVVNALLAQLRPLT